METRINVKDRETYGDLDRSNISDAEVEVIYNQELDAFWDDANYLAQELGFDGVHSEGRSGGHAVPYPQQREITCPTCNGYGETHGPDDQVGPFAVKPPDCPTCQGEGEIIDPDEGKRLQAVADELAECMNARRDEFRARVLSVSEIVGVYEEQAI